MNEEFIRAKTNGQPTAVLVSSASDDQSPLTKCFPDLPWPFKDWCKARGGSAPPPWQPNPNRGDQSVPNYGKEAVASIEIPNSVKIALFVGLALTTLWLVTRLSESWNR